MHSHFYTTRNCDSMTGLIRNPLQKHNNKVIYLNDTLAPVGLSDQIQLMKHLYYTKLLISQLNDKEKISIVVYFDSKKPERTGVRNIIVVISQLRFHWLTHKFKFEQNETRAVMTIHLGFTNLIHTGIIGLSLISKSTNK